MARGKIMKQSELWIEANNEAIKNINHKLYDTVSDYEMEFQRVALAITNTTKNPWSFMPTSWEGSKSCAQNYEMFLHTLHHSMCDDGDICFVKRRNDVYLMFIDKWEIEDISADFDKKYSNRHNVEWEFTTAQDFIDSLEEE